MILKAFGSSIVMTTAVKAFCILFWLENKKYENALGLQLSRILARFTLDFMMKKWCPKKRGISDSRALCQTILHIFI
jgi:hypothetical protein